MGGRRKKTEDTKYYQSRQASIKRQKERNAAIRKRRAVAKSATKFAVEKLAEETFGPGGLTPERKEALIAVAVGPDVQGDVNIGAPSTLKMFVRRARKRFLELSESYVEAHYNAVQGALADKDFETAARHSEWAMENLGGKDEGRVVEPAPKPSASTPVGYTPVMVGVNLGGMPNKLNE